MTIKACNLLLFVWCQLLFPRSDVDRQARGDEDFCEWEVFSFLAKKAVVWGWRMS